MAKESPLVQDGVWKEGNLPTGHLTTQRTALTTPTWRRFNEGSQPTKTRTNQITDTCALISDVSEVDRALLKVNAFDQPEGESSSTSTVATRLVPSKTPLIGSTSSTSTF